METILHSEVFDHFDKTYLLDRIVGTGSGPVIRITETVHNGTRRGKQVVEVDASVLARIRAFMEAPVERDEMGKPVTLRRPMLLTGEQKDKLIKSYMKGVSTAALAVQFGCKSEDIERALREEGIVVVDQSPASTRSWRSTWKRKK